MRYLYGLSIFLLAAALISCQKQAETDIVSPDKVNITLQFKPVVDATPLALNTEYRNFLNEPYTVTAFKFYICKIAFMNTASGNTQEASTDGHYLIDASDAASTSVSFQVDPSEYDQLVFVIGVDSIRNVSGSQTGALDPTKGMFWTWNSGYIMAKLEGSSPLSSEPNNKIEYHIGGFKEPENVLQRVRLPIPVTEANSFVAGGSVSISLTANANAWFHHAHDLSIAATPVCATPGELAKMIAENYASMFTLTEISH